MRELLTSAELEQFRRELLRQRAFLLARPEATKSESYPDRIDRATHLSQINAETSLRNQAGIQLGKIAAALKRINLGKYGFCADCGEPIGIRRLRANPAAIYCLQCQCAQA